jgi:TonB family protein
MNKKLSRILFGTTILMYGIIMTISYTSCNSDNSNDKVATTPADTTKIAAKKTKKGNASVTMSSAINKSKTIKDKSGVYSLPEKMPEYPGGESALSLYVQNNLSYPPQALNDNKEGTVRISFIVDEKGNVMDPKVTGNKLGDGLDQEAVNVIKNMPKWKPGTVKGKNV